MCQGSVEGVDHTVLSGIITGFHQILGGDSCGIIVSTDIFTERKIKHIFIRLQSLPERIFKDTTADQSGLDIRTGTTIS